MGGAAGGGAFLWPPLHPLGLRSGWKDSQPKTPQLQMSQGTPVCLTPSLILEPPGTRGDTAGVSFIHTFVHAFTFRLFIRFIIASWAT